MKLVPAFATFLWLTLPAFAQEATKPPIDWSKPVIVDGNILQVPDESAPRPVEVYTLDELRALGSPSMKDILNRKPAQPCDPQKQGGEVRCTLPQEKPLLAEPSADPLANYSPEMREKLLRFMPKPQQE